MASPSCSSASNARSAGVGPDVTQARLGAEERGRHHDLVAEDEAVQVEVVAVELPAPRLVVRRRPEEAEEVGPLAVLVAAAR